MTKQQFQEWAKKVADTTNPTLTGLQLVGGVYKERAQKVAVHDAQLADLLSDAAVLYDRLIDVHTEIITHIREHLEKRS